MAELTGPFLEIKWGYNQGEDGWGDGVNEDLIKLAFYSNKRIDGSVASLPGVPADGEAYFLTTDQRIHARANATWYDFPIPVGTIFVSKVDESLLKYDGTATLASLSEFDADDRAKLDGIESGAEANNISDINAGDLTDGTDSTLHFHSSDRDRSNHTGTQDLSSISDAGTSAGLDYIDDDSFGTASDTTLATSESIHQFILNYIDPNDYGLLDGSNTFTQLNVDDLRLDGNTLYGTVNGQTVELHANDTGGVDRTLLIADPDGALSLYYDGSLAARTSNSGFHIIAPTNDNPQLAMYQDDGTTLAFQLLSIGSLGSLIMGNRVNGGTVSIAGNNAAGSSRTFLLGDPDGNTQMFHSGISTIRTETASNGGLEVNNQATGAGFERVLTVSDGNGYQALDDGLTSIAGLTTAADRMIYTTDSDTYAVTTLTAAGRALLDDADADAQLATLGLTATATELNYVDGVTSAIQTQLDTKYESGDNIVMGSSSTAPDYGGTNRRVGWVASTVALSTSRDMAVADLGHILPATAAVTYTVVQSIGEDGNIVQVLTDAAITIAEGTGVTITYKDGSGAGPTGDFDVAADSTVTLVRRSSTAWDLFGNGITAA